MRHPNDFYPTPPWVTQAVMPYVMRNIVWHEPACGDGAICKVLSESHVEYSFSDLNGAPIGMEGVNFLRDNTLRHGIVTNPPFSLAFEFCKHAVNHAPHVFMLLRLNFLASQTRSEWFKRHEPGALFVLSRRPSFTSNGKTDSTDYAWFYWGPEHKGIKHI